MTDNYHLTPQDFRDYFSHGEINYAVLWQENTSYRKDIVVSYRLKNYQSLADNNTANPRDENHWQLMPGYFYALDSDLERAIVQAGGSFNPRLFADDPGVGRMCLLLLTAHYVLQDYSMVNGASNSTSPGIISGKSVGGVSASYTLPEAYLKNPLFSQLAQTPFGLKYLGYITTRAVGNTVVCKGATNPL